MIDISNQLKVAIGEHLKMYLEKPKPIRGKYRKLEDLRLLLKRVFPKASQFNQIVTTVNFLNTVLTKDDIFIMNNYEDKETGERIMVYSVIHKPELQKFAYIPDLRGMLESIASKAQPEVWSYGNKEGKLKYSILESYLNKVLARLKYEQYVLGYDDRIVLGEIEKADDYGEIKKVVKCIINTGLLSTGKRYIFLIFEKNYRADAQEWVYKGLTDDVRSQSFKPFKKIPKAADFHAELNRNQLMITKDINYMNLDHIIVTHCERLPLGFLKNHFHKYFSDKNGIPTTAEEWDKFKSYISADSQEYEFNKARNELQYCIDEACRLARIGESKRANIYRPSEHSVGFFLPLYLEKPKDDMDFKVGIIIEAEDDSYIARTIYRTSMAYERIRVMGSHEKTWLNVKRIEYWINPYNSQNSEYKESDNKPLKNIKPS